MKLPGGIGDYHIHTRFSCDSEAEMTEVCEAAILHGMREIAITDHADFGPNDMPGCFRPIDYLKEIEYCRSLFGNKNAVHSASKRNQQGSPPRHLEPGNPPAHADDTLMAASFRT